MIGGGRILPAHAMAARALPETRLIALAETDPERLATGKERFECKGYLDYRELLADSDVDAVAIALPHWLHLESTVAALQAGKHVLIEKPMAMSVEECDRMIAASQESGKTLMVAHSQHFFPVNLVARQLLADGAIGTPVMVSDTWYKPFWEGKRPQWFLEADKGGGMWPMNGSHMIDRLCFLLQRRVTAVKARVGSPIHGLSATDSGIAFLDFEDGLSATIQHAGYKEGVNRFEAEFTGTEAQLRLGGKDLWLGRAEQWTEVEIPQPALQTREGLPDPSPIFGAQMQEFARSIIEGRQPSITADYGREVVRVMCACEESSRTSTEVRL
jgi:predicted dehydrogenase